MLCPLEVNSETQTNKRKNRKSYPHLNVYFYINIVLNVETSQHLCRIQHMPGCIPSLLCFLTHLSSQLPYNVHTTIILTCRWRIRQKKCVGNLAKWYNQWQLGGLAWTAHFHHHSMTWMPFIRVCWSYLPRWLRWQSLWLRKVIINEIWHVEHSASCLHCPSTHCSVLKLTLFDHLRQMEASSGF